MKKVLLVVLIMGGILITMTGCDNKIATSDELNDVNNKIIEYFQSSNAEYDNLSFNYVDVTNKKVVVGLLDNSKEQQEKFRKSVVDSDFIEFVKGEKLMNHDDYKK